MRLSKTMGVAGALFVVSGVVSILVSAHFANLGEEDAQEVFRLTQDVNMSLHAFQKAEQHKAVVSVLLFSANLRSEHLNELRTEVLTREITGALRQMGQLSGEVVPAGGLRHDEFFQEMGRLSTEVWPSKHNALVADLKERRNSARAQKLKEWYWLKISHSLNIFGVLLIMLKDAFE